MLLHVTLIRVLLCGTRKQITFITVQEIWDLLKQSCLGPMLSLNNKKSLRRKPPPPLNEYKQSGLRINTNPGTDHYQSYHANEREQPSTITPAIIVPEKQNESFDLSFDDLVFSVDSPRLKGPKDLPFDEYSSPTQLKQGSNANILEVAASLLPQEPLKFNLSYVQDPYQDTYSPRDYHRDYHKDYQRDDSRDHQREYDRNNRRDHYAQQDSFLTLSPVFPQTSSSPSVSPDLPPGRRYYPPRKFQSLLSSTSSPFFSRDESQTDIRPTSSIKGPTPSPPAKDPTPPYPVLSDLDFSDSDDSSPREEAHLGDIDINRTPSRIPSLMDDLYSTQMSKLQRSLSRSPDYKFLGNNYGAGVAYPSSPELGGNYSSPLNSPTKSPSFSRYTAESSYSGFLAHSRSSRSPSPKKGNRISPTSGSLNFYPIDERDMNFGVGDDLRTPRWSLIEQDYTDYYYDENEHPEGDYMNVFDYTSLPELPKQEPLTPINHTAFRSTLSLFRNDSGLQSSPTLRRKYDELPPVPLDLPLLPFSSSSLTSHHFATCKDVWSLRNIFAWCIQLNTWVSGQDISEKQLRKALIKLLVFHKRNTPIDIIGKNASGIIETFRSSGALALEPKADDGTKKTNDLFAHFIPDKEVSGVLVDLTGCYCHDADHTNFSVKDQMLKCYSSQCQLNKIIEHEHFRKTTNIADLVLGSDWATHWQLTPEEINNDTLDSKKQSFLFDLIKFEQTFIQRADCFVTTVGPEFLRVSQTMISQDVTFSLRDFGEKLLKSAKDLVSIHKTNLYEPLLKILISDGKFLSNIAGIASLYYEWSKSVRSALLEYMSCVPMIEYLLGNEALKDWDSTLRNNPKVKDLQVNGNLLLMSTFNSRYQQLPLQLMDIRKFYDEQEEEYEVLTKAVDSIKSLGTTVNQMKVHADNVHSLDILQKHLTWKSNIFKPNINLTSTKRKFYYRGDLNKKGDLKINTNTVHVIVLDNYLLITERSKSQRTIRYKVTETPILMDFLIVENRDKEGGITAKVGTSTSTSKNGDGDEDVFTYPFKVRYAGRKHESHTFLAGSEAERNRWISVLEKSRYNLMKRVSPLAPYDLDLVDNCYFAYEHQPAKTKLPVLPPNDPIQMLAESTNAVLKARRVPRDVFSPNVPKNMIERRKIKCAETCTFSGSTFVFVGTNQGVFCTDRKNRWKQILNTSNVTKLTVVPHLNVVLVLGNKVLRHYPLQLLVEVYYERKERLSSFPIINEEILFYEVGRHNEIPTLFVARKAAGEVRFKVFIFDTDANGILTSFSLIKEFYIAGQCYGLSIFNTSIAVHTERGFEVMKLSTLSPRTIPDLPESGNKKIDSYGRKTGKHTDVIRRAISHCSPMGMFKLNNNKEFLLVYKDLAIFVNKAGSLSRTTTVRFDFRPTSISFVDNNLFLVCEEVIEVWSISDSTDGKNTLIQVIPSKGIRMINSDRLMFSTTNPQNQGLQMVFQMLPRKQKL